MNNSTSPSAASTTTTASTSSPASKRKYNNNISTTSASASTSTSATAITSVNWSILPSVLLSTIFQYLFPFTLFQVQQSCYNWYRIILQPLVWENQLQSLRFNIESITQFNEYCNKLSNTITSPITSLSIDLSAIEANIRDLLLFKSLANNIKYLHLSLPGTNNNNNYNNNNNTDDTDNNNNNNMNLHCYLPLIESLSINNSITELLLIDISSFEYLTELTIIDSVLLDSGLSILTELSQLSILRIIDLDPSESAYESVVVPNNDYSIYFNNTKSKSTLLNIQLIPFNSNDLSSIIQCKSLKSIKLAFRHSESSNNIDLSVLIQLTELQSITIDNSYYPHSLSEQDPDSNTYSNNNNNNNSPLTILSQCKKLIELQLYQFNQLINSIDSISPQPTQPLLIFPISLSRLTLSINRSFKWTVNHSTVLSQLNSIKYFSFNIKQYHTESLLVLQPLFTSMIQLLEFHLLFYYYTGKSQPQQKQQPQQLKSINDCNQEFAQLLINSNLNQLQLFNIQSRTEFDNSIQSRALIPLLTANNNNSRILPSLRQLYLTELESSDYGINREFVIQLIQSRPELNIWLNPPGLAYSHSPIHPPAKSGIKQINEETLNIFNLGAERYYTQNKFNTNHWINAKTINQSISNSTSAADLS